MARFPRLALIAAPLLVVTLLAPASEAGGPPNEPGPTETSPAAPAPGRDVAAERAADKALEMATGLFGHPGRDKPDGPAEMSEPDTQLDGRDATMVLRDLAAALPALEGDERTEAERILARPTQTSATSSSGGYRASVPVGRTCTVDVCVHWVERTPDQVPGSDQDLSTIPAYVTQAKTVLTYVHDTYAAAGYREPKPDGTIGGGPQLDVYLEDLGGQSIYGFCTVDEREDPDAPDRSAYGYCALDNDFSTTQYRGDPVENFKATAAHEYFHAVQFGYDWFEDVWLMEASSTWAEAELYPGIKDNLQYLRDSPLTAPGTSLDLGTARGYYYGVWIFLRHLSERWPDETGALPTILKDIWDDADTVGKPAGTDLTGVEAVEAQLRARDSSWRQLLPEFAVANRRPESWYAQAAADSYPTAPLAERTKLSRSDRSTSKTLRLRHLTTATTAYLPTRSLRGAGWRLRVRLDLPRAGSAAMVTVVPKRGEPATQRIDLSRGDGAATLPFSHRKIRSIEVALANADTRYERCGRNMVDSFSCFGNPVGDRFRDYRWSGPSYAVSARAVRR